MEKIDENQLPSICNGPCKPWSIHRVETGKYRWMFRLDRSKTHILCADLSPTYPPFENSEMKSTLIQVKWKVDVFKFLQHFIIWVKINAENKLFQWNMNYFWKIKISGNWKVNNVVFQGFGTFRMMRKWDRERKRNLLFPLSLIFLWPLWFVHYFFSEWPCLYLFASRFTTCPSLVSNINAIIAMIAWFVQ